MNFPKTVRTSGGSEKFWTGGEGRKTVYQPRHHLSQMHTHNDL